MSPATGTRLGPYQITAKLGEGGMGEVYRARDVRLGRDVAVKVLPQHLSSNPAIRARFEREARTISSLNHPHICTLHDVGSDGETDYLVMELIEGETLAARLAKGALPSSEVVRIGAQIASALDRAHRAGVMHRDLKPGNVMLTKSGAKLMDFGLARNTGLARAGDVTASPTVADPLTTEGTLIGTFQYMSPEQLEGKEADARSDLWALGCVLYEMATGKRPFDGKSQASLITAIMGSEPTPILDLAPLTPPALERLIGTCLAKDPVDRIQSAHDVMLQLQWIAAGGSQAGLPAPVASTGGRRGWLLAGTAVLALAAGGIIGWRFIPRGSRGSLPSIGASATSVTGKSLLTDIPGVQGSPSLSPDGKSVAFVSRGRNDDDIFLLRVGGENPVNLTGGTPGRDSEPVFSPDGERIAFCSERDGGGIFLMGATGESPRKLVGEGAHPAWSPDGAKIVYSTERVTTPYSRETTASLWVLDVSTGTKKRLYEGDAVEPSWSPSGGRIAFWAKNQGQRDIKTIPAEGGTASMVTNDAPTDWGPFWAPDGRSIYFLSDRAGSPDLWRVAIDERTGDVRGPPEPITSGVAPVMAGSISADGHRIAVQISRSRSELLRLGFDPKAARVQGEPASIFASSKLITQLDLSRDGRSIAYRTTAPREDIFVMGVDGGDRRRLTDDAFRNRGPRWIHGDWLAFYSNRSGSYQIWLIRRDGTELRKLTDRPEVEMAGAAVSMDSARVAMSVLAGGGPPKLAIDETRDGWFAAGGVQQPIPVETVANAFDAIAWSPDGASIGGFVDTNQGPVVATYAMASRRVERHEQLHASTTYGFTWLPDCRRLLYWDVLRNAAVVADTDARQTQEVPGIPGPSELRLAADGRTLMVNHVLFEGDIWLLTLK